MPNPIDTLFSNFEGDDAFKELLPVNPSSSSTRGNVSIPSSDDAVQALKLVHTGLVKDASKTVFVAEIQKMFTVFKDKIQDIKTKLSETDADPGLGAALDSSTKPSESDLTTAQTQIKTAIQQNPLSKFVQNFAPEFYVYLDEVMTQINKMKVSHANAADAATSVMFTTLDPEGVQHWADILDLCTAAPEATAAPKCPGDSYCLEKLWVYVGGGSIGLVILILLFLSMKGGGRR